MITWQFGHQVAASILDATWQAGLLAILVAVTCRLVPRIPAKCQSAMWLVVLIRLLAPTVPQSNVSIFNLAKMLMPTPVAQDASVVTAHAKQPTDRTTLEESTANTNGITSPRLLTASLKSPTPDSNGSPHASRSRQLSIDQATPSHVRAASLGDRLSFWHVVLAVWAVGVFIVAMRSVATMLALRRLLRACRPVDDARVQRLLDEIRIESGIWQFPKLLITPHKIAPALSGVIHPKIIMSESTLGALKDEDLRWLFRHELAHIRRWDLPIHRLWWCARALHWFNPLVWWAYSRAQSESEFACDESVLAVRSEACGYGQTLLRVAELLIDLKPVPAGVGLLTRGPSLARRIAMISNYRQRSRFATLIAVTLVLAFAGAGLTDAIEDAPPQTPDQAGQAGQPDQKPAPKKVEKKPLENRIVVISVVDSNDKPVAGAHVHAGVWSKDPTKANQTSVCDADGKTTFELPASFSLLRVWATKEGHVPMYAQWWPKFQKDGHLVPPEYKFRLEKGSEIGGFIKNEAGEPIEGVKIEVKLVSPPNQPPLMTRLSVSNWLAESDTARTTDARGYWSLDNVPADDKSRILVKTSHPDYLDDQVFGAAQNAQGITNISLRTKKATITMDRGVSLTGTVVDPQGSPIVKAVVIHGDDPYLQPGYQEVLTNEEGEFQLPRLAAGPTTVTVLAEGWSPHLETVELMRDAKPARFQLKKGRTLRIRFVDTKGQPIPNVYIGIAKWRGRQSLHNHRHPGVLDTKIPRQADERGIYQWKWAPDDEIEYWFEKSGFVDKREVTLIAEDSHVVTLEVPIVVTGKVTDAETGEPIEFFQVRPATGSRMPRPGPETQPGKNGEYRVAIERRSPFFYIVIEADGYEFSQSKLFPGFKEDAFQFDCKLKKRK